MIDQQLLRSFTYVLCPGNVMSHCDGDIHRISYSQLVALWGIPTDKWVAEEYFTEHYFDKRKYIILGPDPTGKYDLEEKIQTHLLELF